MKPSVPASVLAQKAFGAFRWKTTVAASGASTEVIWATVGAQVQFVAGSRSRSNCALTAWALNGVPSVNLTSLRTLTVQSFRSELLDHSVASEGMSLPWGL